MLVKSIHLKFSRLAMGLMVGVGAMVCQTAVHAGETADAQQIAQGESLIASWPAEAQQLLMQQLIGLGYSEDKMAAEASAIEAIKSEEERVKVATAFHAKYELMAILGLRQVAVIAKSAEAQETLGKLEQAIQFNHEQDFKGELPRTIARIYGSMANRTASLSVSPCVDLFTQIYCGMASFFNQECRQFASSWAGLGARGIRTFPETDQIASTGDGAPNEDTYRRLYDYDVRQRNSNSGSLVRSYGPIGRQFIRARNIDEPQFFSSTVGAKWPLKSSDLRMCVNLVAPLSNSEISLYASGWSYARVTRASSVTLNGVGASLSGAGTYCNHRDERSLDVSGPTELREEPRVPEVKTCWFNLGGLYNQTIGTRPYPVDRADPDTHYAAEIEIANNLRASMYHTLFGVAFVEYAVDLTDLEVLTIRTKSNPPQ